MHSKYGAAVALQHQGVGDPVPVGGGSRSRRTGRWWLALGLGLFSAATTTAARVSPAIPSLDALSVTTLRARAYGSDLRIIGRLGRSQKSFLAAYASDGLRVYTRIDVPRTPPPVAGYPVLIFLHGWNSNESAADFDFATAGDAHYGRLIDRFVAAGFVVAYPGWRGYGTFDGRRAEGAEFLESWNNESYLSPVFFAIDTLNLLDGLSTLGQIDWRDWGFKSAASVKVDLRRVHIAGHSQGGDAVLNVLAVAGEGSGVRTAIASGSIWAGCIPSRFVQLETYGPMQATLEAFMSGDGRWTGTPTGRNGVVNPNFVFGWPPDSIETVDPASPGWTWQAQTWSVPTVAEVLRRKYGEMYAILRRNVADLADARFEMTVGTDGRAAFVHDPRVAAAMARIGGFDYPQYLSEPLALHISDQDFYSIPAWNEDLGRRINAAGGLSVVHIYHGNTHGLERSAQAWFSGPAVVPGLDRMIQRDIAFFREHAAPAADAAGAR